MATKLAEPKSAYPKPETEASKKAREARAKAVMEHAEKYAPGVKTMRMGGMSGYKSGGAIDGIAKRGKTRGKIC
jgi:hypothetical protein